MPVNRRGLERSAAYVVRQTCTCRRATAVLRRLPAPEEPNPPAPPTTAQRRPGHTEARRERHAANRTPGQTMRWGPQSPRMGSVEDDGLHSWPRCTDRQSSASPLAGLGGIRQAETRWVWAAASHETAESVFQKKKPIQQYQQTAVYQPSWLDLTLLHVERLQSS